MPRDDAYPPGSGGDLAHAGPQPDVIYGPLCTAHLRPSPAAMKPRQLPMRTSNGSLPAVWRLSSVVLPERSARGRGLYSRGLAHPLYM